MEKNKKIMKSEYFKYFTNLSDVELLALQKSEKNKVKRKEKKMIKPKKLKRGDTVAIVSLSSGTAGDKEFRHRYEQGKKFLWDILILQ